MAGSCRGKVSPPQPPPHLRAWPACTRAAAPPQLAQKPERRCHASRPWAYSASALSVPSSFAAARRVSAYSIATGTLPLVTPPSSVALGPASTAKTGRGSSGAPGAWGPRLPPPHAAAEPVTPLAAPPPPPPPPPPRCAAAPCPPGTPRSAREARRGGRPPWPRQCEIRSRGRAAEVPRLAQPHLRPPRPRPRRPSRTAAPPHARRTPSCCARGPHGPIAPASAPALWPPRPGRCARPRKAQQSRW
eukprot:scaffold70229_cov65-Phaeocystis_antarctica.AAC.4